MSHLVIFDLGGVVTSPAVETIDLKVAEALGISEEEMRKETAEYKSALTKGHLGLTDVYAQLIQKAGLKTTPEDILAKHLEVYSQVLEDLNQVTLEVIKRLKSYNRVVALANTEKEVVPASRKRGLYIHFEKSYLSCELGIMKPDAVAYQTVLQENKSPPEKAIFIDDKLENVQGAEKLGIRGIHFTLFTALEKELAAHGVRL